MSDDATIRPFRVDIPQADLEDLELYPAHFAGSSCGRAMSGKPSSPLDFEHRFNPAPRQRSRDDFVAFMLADLPAGHHEIWAANRLGALGAPISPREPADVGFPHGR